MNRLSIKRKAQNVSVCHLNTVYKLQVARKQEYLKCNRNSVIPCAIRHISMRSRWGVEVSDINHAKHLNFLHIRSKDIPWLGEKLKSQLINTVDLAYCPKRNSWYHGLVWFRKHSKWCEKVLKIFHHCWLNVRRVQCWASHNMILIQHWRRNQVVLHCILCNVCWWK